MFMMDVSGISAPHNIGFHHLKEVAFLCCPASMIQNNSSPDRPGSVDRYLLDYGCPTSKYNHNKHHSISNHDLGLYPYYSSLVKPWSLITLLFLLTSDPTVNHQRLACPAIILQLHLFAQSSSASGTLPCRQSGAQNHRPDGELNDKTWGATVTFWPKTWRHDSNIFKLFWKTFTQNTKILAEFQHFK